MKRGEIYYISKQSFEEVGSEIQLEAGRPGVILSNCDDNSPIVTVAFCTTKAKKPSPKHIEINSTKYQSTVLLEQISSIDKKRIGTYIGECTDEEMIMIDKGLFEALLPGDNMHKELTNKIEELKAKILKLQVVNDSLINKIVEIEGKEHK